MNWITSQGWAVELKGGRVYLTKGAIVADFNTIKAAYFALGGPVESIAHNPRRVKP